MESKEHNVLRQVINKAWEDAAFKEALIANPGKAIERLTGEPVQIPEGKKLVVFDQSDPDIICLNIPPKPSIDDLELSEEQLETVAGGTGVEDLLEAAVDAIVWAYNTGKSIGNLL